MVFYVFLKNSKCSLDRFFLLFLLRVDINCWKLVYIISYMTVFMCRVDKQGLIWWKLTFPVSKLNFRWINFIVDNGQNKKKHFQMETSSCSSVIKNQCVVFFIYFFNNNKYEIDIRIFHWQYIRSEKKKNVFQLIMWQLLILIDASA